LAAELLDVHRRQERDEDDPDEPVGDVDEDVDDEVREEDDDLADGDPSPAREDEHRTELPLERRAVARPPAVEEARRVARLRPGRDEQGEEDRSDARELERAAELEGGERARERFAGARGPRLRGETDGDHRYDSPRRTRPITMNVSRNVGR